MKIIFWVLVVTTVALTWLFWFAVPEQKVQAQVAKLEERAAKLEAPAEAPSQQDKDYRTGKIRAPVKPKPAPVPPPMSAKVGSWLSELSKGTPMVTCGLAVWTHFGNKKKKRSKHEKK